MKELSSLSDTSFSLAANSVGSLSKHIQNQSTFMISSVFTQPAVQTTLTLHPCYDDRPYLPGLSAPALASHLDFTLCLFSKQSPRCLTRFPIATTTLPSLLPVLPELSTCTSSFTVIQLPQALRAVAGVWQECPYPWAFASTHPYA